LSNSDEILTDAQKYELFELCLNITKADGVAEPKEIKIIQNISEAINLDKVKTQLMIEKELPVTIHTGNEYNKEQMIGITTDMDNEQIKNHLRKEYTKWNSRVTNRDPEIRKQAEEMIKIISELRKIYS